MLSTLISRKAFERQRRPEKSSKVFFPNTTLIMAIQNVRQFFILIAFRHSWKILQILNRISQELLNVIKMRNWISNWIHEVLQS